MDIKINQNNSLIESNVSDNVVETLYQKLKIKNTHDQQKLIGRIEINHGYEDAVSFLNNTYRNFRCLTAGESYIRFTDPNVEVLLKNCLTSNNMSYTGSGLTQSDLNQFNDYQQLSLFKNNTVITKFPEFNRLQNLKILINNVFEGCTNLTQLNLANIEKIIGANTFKNCGITEANLISCNELRNCEHLFIGCTNLVTVNIPNVQIERIETNMFNGCLNLENFNVDMSHVVSINNSAFYGCKKLQSIDLSNVEYIGSDVFTNCFGLTSVDLSKCTEIWVNAFYNCTNLTEILNTEHITKIIDSAFRFTGIHGDLNLSACQRLGKNVFFGLTGLTSIQLTQELEQIDDQCFCDCSNLTSVGDLSKVKLFGAGWTFSGCKKLPGTLDLSGIGDGLEAEAGKYASCNGTFNECENLTCIKLGNIWTLGGRWNGFQADRLTFNNCKKLHTLDIKYLKYLWVGSYGYNLNSLRYLILRQTTPPEYTECRKEDVTSINNIIGDHLEKIFVPDSAVNTFKEEWPAIENYIFPLSEYVPIVDE